MAAKHSPLEDSSWALNGVRKGSPRPVAWKPLPSNPERFFIVLRYRELYNELPTVKEVISSYHTYIGIQSRPMGKDTYRGMVPNIRTERFSSWERFFTRLIAKTMAMERRIQGDDPEIESLESSILSRVIPRLLRPIETNGTIVKAVLLHGHLWDGNMATDEKTDSLDTVFFDPSCFYGHNEYSYNLGSDDGTSHVVSNDSS